MQIHMFVNCDRFLCIFLDRINSFIVKFRIDWFGCQEIEQTGRMLALNGIYCVFRDWARFSRWPWASSSEPRYKVRSTLLAINRVFSFLVNQLWANDCLQWRSMARPGTPVPRPLLVRTALTLDRRPPLKSVVTSVWCTSTSPIGVSWWRCFNPWTRGQ